MPHILIELALSMFIIYTSPEGPNSSPSISIEQSRCVKYKQLLLQALLQFPPLAIKKIEEKKELDHSHSFADPAAFLAATSSPVFPSTLSCVA